MFYNSNPRDFGCSLKKDAYSTSFTDGFGLNSVTQICSHWNAEAVSRNSYLFAFKSESAHCVGVLGGREKYNNLAILH